MSDNPEKIAELQNDKLVEILRSKNLGVPVCRYIESKGHNGQQFVKPEYVVDTFPSVEFLRSIKLLKMQIRTLVSVRKELHVETSTVPYLEINNNSNNASAGAAASSSPSTTTASLTAEEAEKLLQEAAPLFSGGKYSQAVELYSKVIDNISLNGADASSKQIVSRALSNRSGSFLKLKKSKQALDDARRCVDVRPSWIRSHLRVAAAAEELKEVDVAILAYQSAIKAVDRSGNVPSKQELESDIFRVQQKQFEKLTGEIHGYGVSPTNARDTLISAVKYCTCPDSVQFFCASIANLAENEANRVLFGTASVHDALLTLSKYCTSTDSAGSFCCSISTLTCNNEANEILLGTASVRDAMVTMSKYCTTNESAASFCYSVGNLSANVNNRILFGTASVRDAVVAMSKYCTTPQSATEFCGSISHLSANEKNQVLFGATSVRDALLSVSKYCIGADSAEPFCRSIFNLTCNNEANRVLLGTASVREAMLAVSKYCTTSDSACSFCCSIVNHTVNENNRILFGTASVRDAMVAVSKYCTTSVSAGLFCSAIENIIHQNDSNGVLFATEAIRGAILSGSAFIDDCIDVYSCCRVISSFHEANPTLFCVKQTVKSLVKLSKVEMKRQSPESIYWFLKTVLSLLRSNQELFDTTEIRTAVERFQKVLNDPQQAEKLEKETYSLDKLSNEEYLDKARQLCVEFRKVVSEKSVASSSHSATDAAVACAV